MLRSRTALIAIGSLIVLGAGIVTMSRAQQPAAPKQEDRISREKHAALRAEVDLLQLEYTAASTALAEAMKRTEELELVREADVLTPIGLAARYVEVLSGKTDTGHSKLQAAPGRNLNEPGPRKQAEADAQEDINRFEQSWKAALGAKKKAFVKLAATLHEKSLELSIYERQHEESR